MWTLARKENGMTETGIFCEICFSSTLLFFEYFLLNLVESLETFLFSRMKLIRLNDSRVFNVIQFVVHC